jgi:hypothetical protein
LREAAVQTGPANFSNRIAARKIAIFCAIALAITLALAAAPESSAQSANDPSLVNYPQFVPFGGAGASLSHGHSRCAMQLGASFAVAPTNSWQDLLLEGGYIGPWANLKTGSALFSANYLTRRKINSNEKFIPFFTAGYSRLFDTGNAINFGGGVDCQLNRTNALRIEARDYYAFTEPRRQDVARRIGYVIYLDLPD